MAIEVQAVAHVNVNCSQLERSLAFYRDFVGLAPGSHTNPVPQAGEGFGLAGDIQWDAYILHDRRGLAGPGLDLLEWKRPAPVLRSDPGATKLGLARPVVQVPSLDEAEEQARLAGVAVRREAGVLECADPDGTWIELRQDPRGRERRLHGVILHCSDLARSVEWYGRVFGFVAGADTRVAAGPEGWSCCELQAPDGEFAIEVRQALGPRRLGAPLSQANQLGLYRMAFLVADMRAARAELSAQGVTCPEPVWLDMGPEIPIEGLWACFFPDPDGTCLELIESPRLEPAADSLSL